MFYLLSPFVLPTVDFVDNQDLFVRNFNSTADLGNGVEEIVVNKFDTWANLFAASKYYHYCDIGNIVCHLELQGDCKIKFEGWNHNCASGIVSETLLIQKLDSGCHDIILPDIKSFEGVSFSLFSPVASPVKLLSGGWYTDTPPVCDNKLAIISCTFRRENYVNHNIKLFEEFITKFPEYQGKIHFFVVDNGKTLDTGRSNNNITIIHNKNSGGAGGFTRGLLEVTRDDENPYSRVLFMDDDVLILPSAFSKTLKISNHLKREFSNAFIGGAMLLLHKKNIMFEDLAVEKDFWVQAYHGFSEINWLPEVLRNNYIPDTVFNQKNSKTDSAWWFCCFSMDLVRQKGFPMPFFIRGDDLEFGWRNNQEHHITMNGIGVWHTPFEYRVGLATEYYYTPRNMFAIHCIYNPDFYKKWNAYFQRTFWYLKNTYNYIGIEVFLHSLKDILSGGEFDADPELQLKTVSDIVKKEHWIKEENYYITLPENNVENKIPFIKRIFNKCKCKYKNVILKFFTRTNFHLIFPDFLCRRHGITTSWFPPVGDFLFKKEVKVYDLLKHQYTIRRHDASSERKYRKEFCHLMHEIEKNYERLHDEFLKAHKEFTSREFWLKYLDLKKE